MNNKRSIVHQLNWSYKVISVFLFIISVVFVKQSVGLFIVSFFLFIIMLFSNIRFRVYLKNLNMFSIFLFVVFFFITMFSLSLYKGIFIIVKLIDIIMYVSVISITSSYYELSCGVRDILNRFGHFLDVSSISFKVASFLSFFNYLYEERERYRFWMMVNGKRYNFSFIDRIDYLIKEFRNLFCNVVRKIDSNKNRLSVKKYNMDSYKYNYRLNKWKKTDTILLVINLLVMFIAFIY